MLQKLRHFLRLAASREPRDRIALRQKLERQPVLGAALKGWSRFRAARRQRDAEGYLRMQKERYGLYAAADEVKPGQIEGDFVAGSWREHDEWPDYEEYLMRSVPRDASWVALEYGCGPGRNLRRWRDRFRRIDGVDISEGNLANARTFLGEELPPERRPRLFLTSGRDCGEAEAGAYDFAFSTICLQHICVHEVRQSIFASLFHCLRPGGRFSAQMGFGVPSPDTVPYGMNFYQATDTNRKCDVAVASPEQLERDLAALGYREFEAWIRPVGPGDFHPNWIFFTAVKPESA